MKNAKAQMAEYYDFPKDFKQRATKADFVFIQDRGVDPFSGGLILDRSPMAEIQANYIVAATNNPAIKADSHILLGLPGFKQGFVRAYVHKKIGKKLYIGCMSGHLITE